MNLYLKEFLIKMVKIRQTELICSTLFFGLTIILLFLKIEWALFIDMPLYFIFIITYFDRKRLIAASNISYYRSEELFTLPLSNKEFYFAVLIKNLISLYSYYLFISCIAFIYFLPKNLQGIFEFLGWDLLILFITIDGHAMAQLRTNFKIGKFNHKIANFSRTITLVFGLMVVGLFGIVINSITHIENSVFYIFVIFTIIINLYFYKNLDERIFNEHDLYNKKGLKWYDIPVAIAMFSVFCLLFFVSSKQFKSKRTPSSINPKHITK